MTLPKGWKASGVRAGTKPSGALDLALMVSDQPASVAGAFTSNKVTGGHIPVCREICLDGTAHGFAVTAGISNSGTGHKGVEDARALRALVEGAAGVGPMLVCATGTIGPLLPLRLIEAALLNAVAALGDDDEDAANAILTTDPRPKTVSTTLESGVTISAMAKGAGMIAPNMTVPHATMLAFITTDAAASPGWLRHTLNAGLGQTFNAITVDGCQSTCDTVLLLANGASGVDVEGDEVFAVAVMTLMGVLAKRIVADAEGATKVVAVDVKRAASDLDARAVAIQVCNSPLVKSACWGGDPNWGRIAQAVGQADAQIDQNTLRIAIGGVDLCVDGLETGLVTKAEAAMTGPEIHIEVDLGVGAGGARFYTCDLSPEYVRFNGEYTT